MHVFFGLLAVILLVLADFAIGGLVCWGALELVNFLVDTGVDFGFLHGVAAYVVARVIRLALS